MKRKLLELLLEESIKAPKDEGSVRLIILPNFKDLDVPEKIIPTTSKEASEEGYIEPLLLDISYRFVPRDLVLNDFGVEQTLSFGNDSHLCKIPWGSIIAISYDKTMCSFQIALDDIQEKEPPKPSHLRLVN